MEIYQVFSFITMRPLDFSVCWTEFSSVTNTLLSQVAYCLIFIKGKSYDKINNSMDSCVKSNKKISRYQQSIGQSDQDIKI